MMTVTGKSQCHERLKEICSCGDESALLHALDSLEHALGLDTAVRCSTRDGLSREIVSGFWERSATITWMVDERGGTSCDIDIVTFGERVVYGIIRAHQYIHYESIDTALFALMNTSYRSIYEREVLPTHLFIDTVYFGSICSRVAIPPAERQTMEAMVAQGDVTALNNWLSSPIPELQLYAMEGLLKMNSNGLVLDPFQVRCLEAVKNKKGDARTCHGCLGSRKAIEQIAKGL